MGLGRAGAGGGWRMAGRLMPRRRAGERAQGAGGRGAGVRRGGGEDGEGFRLVQEVLELGGVAGGAVAELGDQPELAARQVWRGRAAFLAQARRAQTREAAGGQGGEEAEQAVARAGDAGMQRPGDGAEEGEVVGDELEQRGEDVGECAREGVHPLRGGGSRGGGVVSKRHVNIYS